MTTNQNDLLLPDVGRVGSGMSRTDPNIFRSQASPESAEAEEEELEETEKNVFSDEPVDDKGVPIDEQNHH